MKELHVFYKSMRNRLFPTKIHAFKYHIHNLKAGIPETSGSVDANGKDAPLFHDFCFQGERSLVLSRERSEWMTVLASDGLSQI